MINIVIPIAGKNLFFPEDEYPFPVPLIEFNGKTMIEYVLENFKLIQGDKQFVFIINCNDANKYHLDDVLNIITDNSCEIVKLEKQTKGAACSVMMAVEYIDNENPLIIANADQFFDINLNDVVEYFKGSDAGVITFNSVHPRWSYVKVDEQKKMIEAAEKRPISKNAIAGFYYFKRGSEFIKSCSKMIKKDASVNNSYYIAPSLNEMLLDGRSIDIFEIDNGDYHTFYTPQKIEEYKKNKDRF